ncbi:putative lipoprotein YiaD precursor [Pseudovibrio axinellae]|uniref:Putative lipoprotein YiaD n=1 Tax=Pseudovibrio axinellae TaxID=989403 RepID=A0A161V0P8_9HYPH|nr:OmpA family protein [Pseudovibrio axinellae]KZL09462.1 putative lipoprotein YiaD precursor [Pseudovibrio axinellae]SEQ64133.1 Outer membrane protein OmpA [Pseudovibrio axinellae]
MKKLMYAATAIVLGVSVAACTTTNPYTGESRISNTAGGAGLGAATGAIIGAVAGGKSARVEGALVGAAAGGLIGGGIGNYMDRQETKLRSQLQSSGVSVTRNGNQIVLNMPNDVTFGVGEAVLSSRAMQVLNSVALVAKEFPQTRLNIYGHTDNTGSAQFNMQLSQRRADSVSSYLFNQGVNGYRISAAGYGLTNPVASNASEAGRAQNRRVEIVLSPLN